MLQKIHDEDRRHALPLAAAVGVLLSPVLFLLLIALAVTGCSAVGNAIGGPVAQSLLSWGWVF